MRRRRAADAPLLSASQVGDADAFTYVVTKRGEPFADVEPSFRARVAARAEKLEAGGKFFDAEIPITPPRAGRVLRLRLLSHKAGGLRDGAAALLFVEARENAGGGELWYVNIWIFLGILLTFIIDRCMA